MLARYLPSAGFDRPMFTNMSCHENSSNEIDVDTSPSLSLSLSLSTSFGKIIEPAGAYAFGAAVFCCHTKLITTRVVVVIVRGIFCVTRKKRVGPMPHISGRRSVSARRATREHSAHGGELLPVVQKLPFEQSVRSVAAGTCWLAIVLLSCWCMPRARECLFPVCVCVCRVSLLRVV